MAAPNGFKFDDYDPLTGIKTYRRFNYNAANPDASTVDYFKEQDVEGILNANKNERYNAKGKVCEKDRLGFKVAEIPIIVQMKWLTEEGWDCLSSDPGCRKKLKEKLNSSEWRHLRCAELVI